MRILSHGKGTPLYLTQCPFSVSPPSHARLANKTAPSPISPPFRTSPSLIVRLSHPPFAPTYMRCARPTPTYSKLQLGCPGHSVNPYFASAKLQTVNRIPQTVHHGLVSGCGPLERPLLGTSRVQPRPFLFTPARARLSTAEGPLASP